MRTFGRACRGKQNVYLKLVRQTEQKLLELGQDVLPLAVSAQRSLERGALGAKGRRAQLADQ